MDQEQPEKGQICWLLKLPVELLNQIFSYLDEQNEQVAFSRSSKELYEIGLPYTYDELMIRSRGVLPYLTRTLLENPDLAKKVHRIYMNLPCPHEKIPINLTNDLSALAKRVVGQSSKPEFVIELLPAMFHDLNNLVFMNIHTHDTFYTNGPEPALNSLERLVIDYGGSSDFIVKDQLKWFLRAAPKLYAFILRGSFVHEGAKEGYSNITELYLSDNKCLNCGTHHVFDMLSACTELKTFVYDVPSMCGNDENLQTTLMKALKPRRKTLEVLKLYPSAPLCIHNWQYINSLKAFTSLQHLTIATRFMVSKTPPTRVTKLFRNLPRSIVTLDIIKEHTEVNSLLRRLVRAHMNGAYPHLELHILKIPHFMFDLYDDDGYVPDLLEACDEAGLDFNVEEVGSCFCGGLPDDLDFGCDCPTDDEIFDEDWWIESDDDDDDDEEDEE